MRVHGTYLEITRPTRLVFTHIFEATGAGDMWRKVGLALCRTVVTIEFAERAEAEKEKSGHATVAGENYGQGSSREHAAIAPRYLGLRVVIAKSFARIHWQNLVSFGIPPLTFADPADHDALEQGEIITIKDVYGQLDQSDRIEAAVDDGGTSIELRHALSSRQHDILKAGSLIAWMRGSEEADESEAK